MKRALIFLLSFAFAREAMADTFQLIEYGTGHNPVGPIHTTYFYYSLIINEANGQMHACKGDMQDAKIASLACRQVTTGVMPAGPGILADSFHNQHSPAPATTAQYMAIWKINRDTGAVTFCGSSQTRSGPWAGDWSCQTVPLP